MDTWNRLRLEVLGTSVALGWSGYSLLSITPWGLGASLWIVSLMGGGYALSYRWHAPFLRDRRWLLLPIALLALLYVGRDAGMLKFINTLGLGVALVWAVRSAETARGAAAERLARVPGLFETLRRSLVGWFHFLLREIEWRSLTAEGRGATLAAVGRGALLAVPVLMLFGLLLMAADGLFERLVLETFDVNWARTPARALGVGLGCWVAGSFVRGLLMPLRTADEARALPEDRWRIRIGGTEALVVLGSINALFAVFIVVQLPYLFGGMETVLGTAGLTMAQYARRGFFELVTVVVLALPLLMFMQQRLLSKKLTALRRFRILAVVQVALLVLLLVSAAQRMWLYQHAFGLTELRLYVSASIVWLAFVLIWFARTVLRERAERFMPGAALAGLMLVLGLNALNPDALIARTNLARAQQGHRLDVRHLTSLSADAVPVILETLPELSPTHQQRLAQPLLARWGSKETTSWRTWSRSRAAAHRHVDAQREALTALGCFDVHFGGCLEPNLSARTSRR